MYAPKITVKEQRADGYSEYKYSVRCALAAGKPVLGKNN